MRTVHLNNFGIVRSNLPKLPPVVLELMDVRGILRDRRMVRGVYITEMETGEEGTFAWYLVPRDHLPEIGSAITVCYVARERNNGFFADAIEMCREVAEWQILETDGEEAAVRVAASMLNLLQGPAEVLACPEGEWMAVVNGPMLMEVGAEVLEYCGHLNVAVASALLAKEADDE